MKSPIRDAGRARTKAKIEAAAKTAFDTLGWEGSTVRVIAKMAGVSVGAIFAIWDDGKKSLWSEVMHSAPPIDGALARAAPGMLAVLQGLQITDDVDKAQNHPGLSRPCREAIDAVVKAATSRLPFEAF